MKVKIGTYVNFFGPYQLAEMLCFWAKKTPDEYGMMREPEFVHYFGEWLAHGSIEPEPNAGDITSINKERHHTTIYKLLMWVHNRKDRNISIKLDPWDTYSMDSTMALIILPMLEQLRTKSSGAPFVDDQDVPDNLKSTNAPAKENEWDTDDNHFARWDYVLDEMIFAFGTDNDDNWENEFYSGGSNIAFEKLENGMSQMISDGDFKVDREGMKIVQDRINNGHILFGKYYGSLWQ
jgi:hypothetical protein